MKRSTALTSSLFCFFTSVAQGAQDMSLPEGELTDCLQQKVTLTTTSREEVEELLTQGADMHAGDEEGRTALFLASYAGNTQIACLLLEKKAAVNAQVTQGTYAGCTPLMAAAHTNNTALLRLLIQHGARGELVNELGNTALMVAAYEGQYEAAECLVSSNEFNAALNTVNMSGLTALIMALRNTERQLFIGVFLMILFEQVLAMRVQYLPS